MSDYQSLLHGKPVSFKRLGIPKIEYGFTNVEGNHFSNIYSLNFTSNTLFGNLGVFRAETKHTGGDLFRNDDAGVYIYQLEMSSDVGLRIYKEFADYRFNGYWDDKLISRLMDRAHLLPDVDFPIGVVTKDGFIIGQIIKYYDGYRPFSYFITNRNTSEILDILTKVVIILKKLQDAGISYIDIHPGNFLFSSENKSMKLIDFDSSYVKFDDNSESVNKLQFLNLSNLFRIAIGHFSSADKMILPMKSFEDAWSNIQLLQSLACVGNSNF